MRISPGVWDRRGSAFLHGDPAPHRGCVDVLCGQQPWVGIFLAVVSRVPSTDGSAVTLCLASRILMGLNIYTCLLDMMARPRPQRCQPLRK